MLSHRISVHEKENKQCIKLGKLGGLIQQRTVSHGFPESAAASRGWKLRPDAAEGLCIRTEGHDGNEDETEVGDRVSRWCQRKSVWCASSCHKCIDIRHRHSSPLSTERLALVCVCVLKNVPVREISRVTIARVRAAYVGHVGHSSSWSEWIPRVSSWLSGRQEVDAVWSGGHTDGKTTHQRSSHES